MPQSIKLNYNVPINFNEGEVKEGLGDFLIAGTAINATVTSNNHKFLPDELRASANTLTGVPLLVDHDNRVDCIKGRVMNGEFNELQNKVDFKAKVVDSKIKQMIKDGLINSVSVGAVVKDVLEEDGFLVPKGITFKELSLVAVPADSQATFNIALKEAYDNKIKEDDEEDDEDDDEIEKEDDEEIPKEEIEIVNSQPAKAVDIYNCKEVKMSEDKIEAKAEVVKEVPKEDRTNEILEAMKKMSDEISALKLKLKEAEAQPEVKEDKPEEKSEEKTEEISKYNLIQSFGSIRGGAFTLVR